MIKQEEQKQASLRNKKEATPTSERDTKGRFLPGNTISRNTNRVTGISTGDIRRHRAVIGDNMDSLLEMLLKEAISNNNTQIAMWLVSRILPEAKKVTFADTPSINNISTLTELKNQSAQTIQDILKGDVSLEEASSLMNAYKEQKSLIEAADIEPLVEAVKNQMQTTYRKN